MPATRTRKPAKPSHYAGVRPAARCDAAASAAAWTHATKITAMKDFCFGMVACGPEQRGGHQATSVLATVHVLSQQLALVLPEALG